MTFLPPTDYEALAPQWQSLRDELAPFIGERAVSLFAYAISDESGCAVWASHFRAGLVANGEDPDNPQVTEAEQLLIDWGRLIARDPAGVPEAITARLEKTFSPALRVTLLAFAAQTVAATVFATAGQVDAAS